MAGKYALVVSLVCAFCAVGATPVLGDWYDDFSDGSYFRVPPGPWDPCDPNWTVGTPVGAFHAFADANDGALRMYIQPAILYGVIIAAVDEGFDEDPNTSPYWFDDSAPHYILSWVQWQDPNFGAAALAMHASWDDWRFYVLESEWPDGTPSQRLITAVAEAQDWREVPDGGSQVEEPNLDRWNGFWMLLQFISDGDPNNSYLCADAWNGNKYDWDGMWPLYHHILTGWPDANESPYLTDGWCGIISYCFQESTGPNTPAWLRSDIRFDNVEARWGYWGDQFPATTLTLKLKDANTVILEPNLPQYAKGQVVVCDAVCNGTKAFKKWTIKGPNDESDPLYQIIVDTNEVLYLTMAGDYLLKATCKCGGGGIEPFAAMVLLMLGLTVVIRRLT